MVSFWAKDSASEIVPIHRGGFAEPICVEPVVGAAERREERAGDDCTFLLVQDRGPQAEQAGPD